MRPCTAQGTAWETESRAPDLNAQPSLLLPLPRNHTPSAIAHSLSSAKKKRIAGAESCGNNDHKSSVCPRRCLRYNREGGGGGIGAGDPTPPRPGSVRCAVELWRREQIKGHCKSFRFDVGAKKPSAKKRSKVKTQSRVEIGLMVRAGRIPAFWTH